MSSERKKVLEMLAAGTITAEDADRLLERLEGARGGAASTEEVDEREDGTAASGEGGGGSAPGGAAARGGSTPGRIRYLRVLVDSNEGDKVNIRVPIALVRTGINLATMVPSDASKKLEESGIDLSQLSSLKGEALIEALRDLTVDIDASDGETVRVFCE
ncbi:MAG: hypothetical protein PVF43_07805 [Candidatus Eiseniibacteriota bacterium]|jgi:hypothetical protein